MSRRIRSTVFASCAGLMTNCPAAFSDVFTADHEASENGSESRQIKSLMINNKLCWLWGVIKWKPSCIKFITLKMSHCVEQNRGVNGEISSSYKRIATYYNLHTCRSQIWCVTSPFHPVPSGWFETSLDFHFRKNSQAVKLNQVHYKAFYVDPVFRKNNFLSC